MAEEEQGRPTDRKMGQVEEQEEVYAPARYEDADPDSPGRWVEVAGNAVMWTDDRESAGIAWLKADDLAVRLWQHFQVAKLAGTPAGVAYELALRMAGDQANPEQQGQLEGAAQRFEEMMHAEE